MGCDGKVINIVTQWIKDEALKNEEIKYKGQYFK